MASLESTELKDDGKEDRIMASFSKEEKNVYTQSYLEYLKSDLRKEIRFNNNKCQYEGCNNKPTIDASKLKGDMYICQTHRRELVQKFQPKDSKYTALSTVSPSQVSHAPMSTSISISTSNINDKKDEKMRESMLKWKARQAHREKLGLPIERYFSNNSKYPHNNNNNESTDNGGFFKYLVMSDEELYNASMKESNNLKSDYFAHYNAMIEVQLYRIRSRLESMVKNNNNNNSNNNNNNNSNMTSIVSEKLKLQCQYKYFKDLSKSLLMIRKLCNPIWLIFVGIAAVAVTVAIGVGAAYMTLADAFSNNEKDGMICKLTQEIEESENISVACETRIRKGKEMINLLNNEINGNKREIKITETEIERVEKEIIEQDKKIENFDWQIENYRQKMKEEEKELATISIKIAQLENQGEIEQSLQNSATISWEQQVEMISKLERIAKERNDLYHRKTEIEKRQKEEIEKEWQRKRELANYEKMEREKEKIRLKLDKERMEYENKLKEARLEQEKKNLESERIRKKENDLKTAELRAQREGEISRIKGLNYAFYVYEKQNTPDWSAAGYNTVFDTKYAEYGDYVVMKFQSGTLHKQPVKSGFWARVAKASDNNSSCQAIRDQVTMVCDNNSSCQAIRDELNRIYDHKVVIAVTDNEWARKVVWYLDGDRSQFVSANGFGVFISK